MAIGPFKGMSTASGYRAAFARGQEHRKAGRYAEAAVALALTARDLIRREDA